MGYLTNIVAVSAGDNYTVAINNDGYVFAWGYNGYGQLGDGNIMTDSDIPVYINGEYGIGYLTDVIAIAAGDGHTIALKNDGTLCACGNGTSGQLGDGWFGISRDWMRPVLGEGGNGALTDVDAVAGGASHTGAIKIDGTLRAWGKNDNGQLGNGNSGIDKNTPVFVTIFYTGWYY
jgi:alpha-tubulin suppressor-like RCC1 family protein